MIDIGDVTYDDKDGLDVLYGNAFPDEELRPVVKALSFDTPNVISLVALVDGVVSGHVAFTLCAVENGTGDVALLAPLAVAPARQRKGLGSMLVREGFQRLRNVECAQVCVLGDPRYYGRFGFRTETRITPPYPLPEEWLDAWQSINLDDGAPAASGQLIVPPAWRDPSYWGP